jgi:hypothetical protein
LPWSYADIFKKHGPWPVLVTLIVFCPGAGWKISGSFVGEAEKSFARSWDMGPDLGTVDMQL